MKKGIIRICTILAALLFFILPQDFQAKASLLERIKKTHNQRSKYINKKDQKRKKNTLKKIKKREAVIVPDEVSTYSELPLAVVICSYNNEEWAIQNLDSVLTQNYSNYHIYYIDDGSVDATPTIVKEYIEAHNLKNKITFLRNDTNYFKLYNMYHLIQTLPDQVIVVELDGDDWFASPGALSYINNLYHNRNIWLTYGRNQEWPSGNIGWHEEYPEDVIKNKKFREYTYHASQPRSFYAWLFKQIKQQDLFYKGNFYPVATDVAYMLPMFEMAGQRSAYIGDILYIRNRANVINTEKRWSMDEIKAFKKDIRAKHKYPTLNAPVLNEGEITYEK
ncbi:MAG: glycosyltransferase family 2 protein [Candidatus Babeliales bacterium]